MEIKQIDDRISYILPNRDPCSSNVVMLEGDEYLWLYDAGRDPAIIDYINGIDKKKNIIISHFHGDHTENLPQLHMSRILQSKYTFEHTGMGEIIRDVTEVSDGIKFTILPFPAVHAKGCLALDIEGKYLLVGDATYPKKCETHRYYVISMVKQQIDFLKDYPCEYILISHHEPYVQTKENILGKLENIYNRRIPGEPYVNVPL